MVRKLKYHEATLLRKLDFINWKSDNSLRENKILRRYNVQDREDYHTYNKVVGHITKLVTQLKGLNERDPVRIEVTDLLLDKVRGRPPRSPLALPPLLTASPRSSPVNAALRLGPDPDEAASRVRQDRSQVWRFPY